MNTSATTLVAGIARPGLAILWGGFICGAMDITAAITVYGTFGLKPVPLLCCRELRLDCWDREHFKAERPPRCWA
jgi:hypothetical protein